MIIEAKKIHGSYGLMSQTDFETMDTVLDLVCKNSGAINTLELGVHKGYTSRGIHDFMVANSRVHFHTGIDNAADLQIEKPYDGCHIIIGNTFEVYNQIPDASQHLIFQDANHSYPMTVLDFWLYCKKLRTGGYYIMHDTGEQIVAFQDYQRLGSKDDPDMFIACRRAAADLGLLNPRSFVNGCQFENLIDRWDASSPTGGMLVLKKLT